ncbi:MAG: zinc ribbon domain-containing protein [Candidatus Margulisbacteria bacterium]|nr:zinc ribbon domain-containing protein [Candidatus Margulisiibacteriota bacterium]MBU1617364.1 zinc ribbon domain-containing protein [Candidatus Margulisiibacteriota bacterium]
MEQVCQSCSMPLRREEDLGTNADGSKNQEYCHFCYKDGKFTDGVITMEQKIEKLVGMAAKMNISEAQARQMAQNILPNLKRWKKK